MPFTIVPVFLKHCCSFVVYIDTSFSPTTPDVTTPVVTTPDVTTPDVTTPVVGGIGG